MKRNVYTLLIACAILGCAGATAEKQYSNVVALDKNANESKPGTQRPPVNLNLDKESAVKIAEIILPRIYGEKVLNQKPWIITDHGKAFTIKGTFHGSGLGGTVEISISKANAEVLYYTHGK